MPPTSPATGDTNAPMEGSSNLAHRRPPSPHPSTHIHIPTPLQRRCRRRNSIRREAEPQKRSASLRLMAALRSIMCTIRNKVGGRVLGIAAAMHTQVTRRRDAADEEEERVERVEDDSDERVEGELFFQSGGDEVEKGEHAED